MTFNERDRYISLFNEDVERLAREVLEEGQHWLDYLHDNSVTRTPREYQLPDRTASLRAEMQRSLDLPVAPKPNTSKG